MTQGRTLLADMKELRNVLRAMDGWEAAGGDLASAHDRRCFVDGLDDVAIDELSSLALTRLACLVWDAKAETRTADEPGDRTSPAASDPVRPPSQGQRRKTSEPVSVG